jgi:transcriptional regulator with XRE-family HTH domain
VFIRYRRDVGALIRDHRKQKGWTQEALATKLGKTRRWMTKVELGQTNPDISSVLRALQLLDVALQPVELPPRESDPALDKVLLSTSRGGTG